MTFRIVQHYNTKNQYLGLSDNVDRRCVKSSVDHQEYIVDNKDACIEILKQFIDCPDEIMTIASAAEEYKGLNPNISNDCLQRICNYYNDRKKLFDDMKTEIDNIDKMFSYHRVNGIIIKRDIPFELYSFDFYGDIKDDKFSMEKSDLIEAYISVEINNQ